MPTCHFQFVAIINSFFPSQVADLVSQLERIPAGSSLDQDEIAKFIEMANGTDEHLEQVGTPINDSSTRGHRSAAPPSYAFDVEERAKAGRARHRLPQLRGELGRGNRDAGLMIAREIEASLA
jgi:hypothetical protein